MSARLSKRVTELENAISLVGLLGSTLRYTMAPMETVVGRLSAMADMPAFLERCHALCAAGGVFPTAWALALAQTPTALDDDDRKVLLHLGTVLGATDLDGALGELDYAGFLLKQRYGEAKARKQQLGTMYRTLGVLAGVGIVILL